MSKPGGVNYSSISKTADLIKALKKDKNDLQKIVEKNTGQLKNHFFP